MDKTLCLSLAAWRGKTYRLAMRFLRILPLVCLLAGNLHAQEKEEGFLDLFNGRDLSGWVNVNCAPSTWPVRENMIVCTGIPTGGAVGGVGAEIFCQNVKVVPNK